MQFRWRSWRSCTAGGTAPVDSSVQRQPTVPCPGLSAVSSPTSAVGSDTVYSSQEMGTFYPVDTTHRDNLDEIVIEMEGRQVVCRDWVRW